MYPDTQLKELNTVTRPRYQQASHCSDIGVSFSSSFADLRGVRNKLETLSSPRNTELTKDSPPNPHLVVEHTQEQPLDHFLL